MIKRIVVIISVIILLNPIFAFAQIGKDTETFEAKIIEVIEEKEIERENQTSSIQQNLQLKGLEGNWKGKIFEYTGISELDILSMSNARYDVGDKVYVNWFKHIDGKDEFNIIGYVRRGYIYLLGLIFAVVIVIVGKKKGLRSLLSLIISFFIIIKFIIPGIINGYNPLAISLVGSAFILGIIMYTTDGFNRKTHIAIVSVLISLFITFLLSLIFVKLTRLSGFSSEEASFLVAMPLNKIIDFNGLLLAGILIGTLGVLDDAILSQVEVVDQIKKANPKLTNKEVVRVASKVGSSHLGAIVNTLFLTYAGASLPLLILFNVSDLNGLGVGYAIDNEFIATEIVRTIAGSIGLALAFPISIYMATYFLAKKT